MKEGGIKLQREKEPEARSKIWSAVRYLKRFSLEDLETTTHQSYPHVRRYVRRLLESGYLRLVEEGKGGKQINVYRLVRDTGPKAPMPRRNVPEVFDPNTKQTFREEGKATGRELAWELMRRGEEFSCKDLVAAGLQQANALKYLAGLLEAGYLYQVKPTKFGPGGAPATYRILRDTGALAPVVQRNGEVFDPNLQEEGSDEQE